MGSKSTKPVIGRCNTCSYELYHECKQCFKCYPILQCQQCRQDIKLNISIDPSLDFKLLRDLYESGIITQLQCYKSLILSSRIPFSKGKILHHALIQLQIQHTVRDELKKQKIIIDCQRDFGLVKVIMNKNRPTDMQPITDVIPQNQIKNKIFKSLYNEIVDKWQGKQYHRYQNNCFDFITNVVIYLCSKIDAKITQSINKQKSIVISKYWD